MFMYDLQTFFICSCIYEAVAVGGCGRDKKLGTISNIDVADVGTRLGVKDRQSSITMISHIDMRVAVGVTTSRSCREIVETFMIV